MIRFRWAVLAVWVVAVVAAGAASAGLSDLLTNRFVLPGSESEKAADILKDHFGQKPTARSRSSSTTPPGRAQALLPSVRTAGERAAQKLPDRAGSHGARAVSDHVVDGVDRLEAPAGGREGHTAAMRRAAGEIPGSTPYLTGQAAIEHDLDPVQNHDLLVGELFIAIPIALLILIFVFGSLAFLLPFMLAAAAIPDDARDRLDLRALHDALDLPARTWSC